MKKVVPLAIATWCLFTFVILSSFELLPVPPSSLIVEPGQVLQIPPRLYRYDTIHIKQNGILKVNDNGSKWLVLHAKVIICDGRIQYAQFRRGLGTITQTLENGEKLEHTFHETLGGAGGNGSGNGRQAGGSGFSPTDYNGGGGGSGAYYYRLHGANLPGVAATDYRGAPPQGSTNNCFGGNGGRQPYGHGGLICLIADKITFGSSATISLRGSDGANGTSGGSGTCYGGGAVYYKGGGGGGGGAAGGNGGVLIVKCDHVSNTPPVDVNPGMGGQGGLGGRAGGCNYHGQMGREGEAGELGFADWQ